ncbi:jg8103 [Pararge aegeria aegeria]|uniref:Jg8103 protein n=1 Tax=Pararge aegeria aegeria TaxID=348720 RepID=A0A8S4SD31_9NEOP|nr:jg8103 [Pararge aegeria aegeria]
MCITFDGLSAIGLPVTVPLLPLACGVGLLRDMSNVTYGLFLAAASLTCRRVPRTSALAGKSGDDASRPVPLGDRAQRTRDLIRILKQLLPAKMFIKSLNKVLCAQLWCIDTTSTDFSASH